MYELTELCKELDGIHYLLFQAYEKTKQPIPRLVFLHEDCYIPCGAEECLSFLAYTLDYVHFILRQSKPTLAQESIRSLNSLHSKIRSALTQINEDSPLIIKLKKHVMGMVQLTPLPTYPSTLSIFIKEYGVFNPDGSLSEEKLFIIQNKIMEWGHYDENKFHMELQKFIKLTYPGKILQNIPANPDEIFFKEKIKEYSDLPSRGINNHALFKFLHHYIFMHRWNFNKQPLEVLIHQLETKPFKFLTENLRDEATKAPSDMWNSGKHEWLPCNNILNIIKRSAGLVENTTPFTVSIEQNNCRVIDWLTIHAELRSDVKRLYFNNNENSIESGHVPAIRTNVNDRGTKGTKTEGTGALHAELNDAFSKSNNPREFIRMANLISSKHIQSGKKHIEPSRDCFFTAEGKKTNDETAMNKLRHAEILPAYKERKRTMSLFSTLTISGNNGNNIDSPHSTDTEITNSTEDSNSEEVMNNHRYCSVRGQRK